jgi:ABC-2 type transport system permease protein
VGTVPSFESDVPNDVSVRRGAVQLPALGAPTIAASAVAFVRKTGALVRYDAQKIRHDPTDLFTRAVQPALWLVVFGEVVSRMGLVSTGGLSYIAFLAPGILAQSVMFISIFYGIQTIWERDLGIVYKLLASPTPRSAIVLGKGLAGSLRGLSQALVVILLAVGLGVTLNTNPLDFLGVLLVVLLTSILFVSFSTIIATIVKTQDRFMGVGQLLTMPLFFASSAIYPISIMPDWLRPVAYGNPLTYAVDALRPLMVHGGSGLFPLGIDLSVLTAFAVALVLIGARLYPRMAQ